MQNCYLRKTDLFCFGADSILNLQETEIPGDMNTGLLEIANYTLEVEKSLSKRRVATYVHKDVKYKRRFDLELENSHMLIIDVNGPPLTRVVNLK